MEEQCRGPLAGIRVVEIAGIGAAPFATMMLADMGADVIRIDRIPEAGKRPPRDPRIDLLNRGRRSIALDLRNPAGIDVARRLIGKADVLIEGFRPGVLERMGLAPDSLMEENSRLIVGRLTGWGQSGPRSADAGHDINFIGLTGALMAIGPGDGDPTPPLNVLGDFAGGGMYLAFGIVCALLEARKSGRGQVIDAAMVDGTASLLTVFYALAGKGLWNESRASNRLDGGAPHYRTYRTSDGGYMAVGALEEKFFEALTREVGADPESVPSPNDHRNWPELAARLDEEFARHSRDEWTERFSDPDQCVSPVLTFSEAMRDPHLVARETFVEHCGMVQPAPAPRFSRTPGRLGAEPPYPGEHTDAILSEAGLTTTEIEAAIGGGAAGRYRASEASASASVAGASER